MPLPLAARLLRRACSRLPFVTVTALLAAEAAQAQAVLHEYVGAPPTQGLGGYVASIGDANGDGVDDYATRYLQPQSSSFAATVVVIDGRKGVPLALLPDKNLVGVIGDIDADGTRDLILGPSPLGSNGGYEVVSGHDLSLIHPIPGGFIGGPNGVYELENADGDATPDYVLNGPYSVRVYAGVDGSLLHSFGYPNAPGNVGSSDAIGDLDSDGVTDLVVPGSWNGQTDIMLLSGVDGSLIQKAPLGSAQHYPTAIGDVNKDSTLDFALSNSSGGVEIRSGASLAVLGSINAPQWSWSGAQQVEPAGDVNGDGFPDLLVSDFKYPTQAGQVGGLWLFSGRDGTVLSFLAGTTTAPLDGPLGGNVDLNGDGLLDVLCGRPGHVVGSVQGVGSVLALSFEDCPAIAYCTAKVSSQGCVPFVHGVGTASLGGPETFSVVAGKVYPQQFGLLVWSQSPAALPFGGGTLCVGSPLVRTSGQFSGGSGACSGSFAFQFSHDYLDDQGLGIGSSVYCQYWYRDPGLPPPSNIGLTDGVVFAVCP
jgi:hypothetical protein